MVGPKGLSYAREHMADRQIDAMQERTRRAGKRLNQCPFIVGRMKSIKFVASTHKTINHGLGVPAAFILARSNYDPGMAGPTFAESDSTYQAKVDPNNQLSVVCSATCTVDLWFYPRSSQAIDPTTGQSV